MGAPSKRARKTRKREDFTGRQLQLALQPPKALPSVHAWPLDQIYSARSQQLLGRFHFPASMAVAMRTDDALFVAHQNRIAPHRSIGCAVQGTSSAKGRSIAREADALFGPSGIGLTVPTLNDVLGCLVDHGVAFCVLDLLPRADGSRIDVFVRFWPIEFTYWDESRDCYMAIVEGGHDEPIEHGNGRWVVFSNNERHAFKHGAILPACLVWARHAFGARDWAKGSSAHGNAKVIGEMPEGVALQKEGTMTAEAQAFIELLRAMASSDTPVGIRPAGSKTEYVVNNSTAWQVFEKLILNAEKAAARIYLGTDGVLGSQGGAPGVDLQELFGVATTKVEGDLHCLERAIDTGVIEVWCALNFGDSTLSPKRRYLLPDKDAEALEATLAKRTQDFHDAIARMRANGFVVTQGVVDDVARAFKVAAPALPESSSVTAPSVALGPAELARVVSVNEARAAAGLDPLELPDGAPDPDGRLTLDEYTEKKAAVSEAKAAERAAAAASSAAANTA